MVVIEKTILAKRIQELRDKVGLTQEQLWNKAKISKGALQSIESGEGNPTAEILSAIATALGVSLASLFKEHDDYHEPKLKIITPEEKLEMIGKLIDDFDKKVVGISDSLNSVLSKSNEITTEKILALRSASRERLSAEIAESKNLPNQFEYYSTPKQELVELIGTLTDRQVEAITKGVHEFISNKKKFRPKKET